MKAATLEDWNDGVEVQILLADIPTLGRPTGPIFSAH